MAPSPCPVLLYSSCPWCKQRLKRSLLIGFLTSQSSVPPWCLFCPASVLASRGVRPSSAKSLWTRLRWRSCRRTGRCRTRQRCSLKSLLWHQEIWSLVCLEIDEVFFYAYILWNNSALTNLQSPLHAVFHVLCEPEFCIQLYSAIVVLRTQGYSKEPTFPH
jgi:hypothetical protein